LKGNSNERLQLSLLSALLKHIFSFNLTHLSEKQGRGA